MLTIDKDLFEEVKCLVDCTYTDLVSRHTSANIVGSKLPMDDLDELLAYTFLFNEVSYDDYINQEGFNNKLSNRNIMDIRSRVSELSRSHERQNF